LLFLGFGISMVECPGHQLSGFPWRLDFEGISLDQMSPGDEIFISSYRIKLDQQQQIAEGYTMTHGIIEKRLQKYRIRQFRLFRVFPRAPSDSGSYRIKPCVFINTGLCCRLFHLYIPAVRP
jgi:hypothetical protein